MDIIIQKLKNNTVKILLNARAFIINNAFSIEGDGRLLEATLFGNVQAFIYRILNYWWSSTYTRQDFCL